MSDEVKPSLAAVAALSEAESRRASTRMFGQEKFVDYEKFALSCFEAGLQRVKPGLLELNENLATDIAAIATPQQLQAFVEREDVELTHNAVSVAVQRGRPYRIDEVGVHPKGRFALDWAAQGSGFGQMYFYVADDGKLHVDSECMGRHFVRSVLLRLADEVIID
jgi:hypothetical protein